VFYGDAAQRAEAEVYMAQLRETSDKAIVTELKALGRFAPVPDDQQDYAARHPAEPYIVINDLPKLARLRQEFPHLYRQ
jgi:peptide-methionine (S)-S-oxide reductase